jgi:hypothetical protein
MQIIHIKPHRNQILKRIRRNSEDNIKIGHKEGESS